MLRESLADAVRLYAIPFHPARPLLSALPCIDSILLARILQQQRRQHRRGILPEELHRRTRSQREAYRAAPERVAHARDHPEPTVGLRQRRQVRKEGTQGGQDPQGGGRRAQDDDPGRV